ncbi:thioredoxin family protein [Flavobacterium sp. W22_SRS_FK3]|uniref:thioredoxin family protein n=1 Tax=Flavobacterium sp. W22_SRS_FK3 TaxID=3240275 RepID=UPI003F8FA49B
MKQKLLFLLFFFSSFLLHSQSALWKTNMNEAILLSDEERKPMLIFFTAGPISEQMQKEIFSTPDFIDWSENVVLLQLDLSDASISSTEREQNLKLKEALGVEELPKVCLATASVRKNRPTINKLGLLDYKQGGAKKWLSEAKRVLRGE